jgi:hypothetical protein
MVHLTLICSRGCQLRRKFHSTKRWNRMGCGPTIREQHENLAVIIKRGRNEVQNFSCGS